MGNITERKSLELFLNYIGKPVKSISEVDSKKIAEYKKYFDYGLQQESFLNRINSKYFFHKNPLEEVIFCSSMYMHTRLKINWL